MGRSPQGDAEFLMRDTTSHPPAYAPAYKTSVLPQGVPQEARTMLGLKGADRVKF